jgi:hypothetical protein
MEEAKNESETSSILPPTSMRLKTSLEGKSPFTLRATKFFFSLNILTTFRLVVLFSVLIVITSGVKVQINLANT